jgi:hypothetical protein
MPCIVRTVLSTASLRIYRQLPKSLQQNSPMHLNAKIILLVFSDGIRHNTLTPFVHCTRVNKLQHCPNIFWPRVCDADLALNFEIIPRKIDKKEFKKTGFIQIKSTIYLIMIMRLK